MQSDCSTIYGNKHFTFEKHNDPARGAFSSHARSLPELGEILRRAGRVAGLIPRSEFKVKSTHTKGTAKIDWVWLDQAGKVVAAFEIEGQDVEEAKNRGLDKDRQTLAAPELKAARLRAVVLFQVDHDGSCKSRIKGVGRRDSTATVLSAARQRCEAIAGNCGLGAPIQIAWDQDLCARRPDGTSLLQEWVERAAEPLA